MILDFDIYRSANLLVTQHGEDAPSRLDRLREIRRAVSRALPVILEDTGHGVASHQLDIFLFEPGTDCYLGRLCQFKDCPAAKADCLVPGCGATSFLQQHQGFVLQSDTLGPARAVRLFDRTTGERRRAVDLPGPSEDETQLRPRKEG